MILVKHIEIDLETVRATLNTLGINSAENTYQGAFFSYRPIPINPDKWNFLIGCTHKVVTTKNNCTHDAMDIRNSMVICRSLLTKRVKSLRNYANKPRLVENHYDAYRTY